MAFLENRFDCSTRYGHNINHQQVSGNARVHNGDNNYLIATPKSVQDLLPRADGAQINSSLKQHEPSCLPGTRIDVLHEIKSWAEDGSDNRCVFWLSGMAGTGKSTIARTVARKDLAQNARGASFFFSKGGGDVGNARKFFTTIAFQLTQRSPALKAGILEAVNENLDMGTLREQWELLILRPLTLLRQELPQKPLLLVIDALDECDGERDVRLILQLLASANTYIPTIQLRILVTSRPDVPIRLGFGENPGIWHRDLVLNEVPREIVDHDIAIYFSEELKGIRHQLDRHIISRLVDKACGLFIWAATACRFIKRGKHYAIHAPKRLSIVLEGGTDQSYPEKELDQIYTKILSESIGETQQKDDNYEVDEDKFIFELFRQIVGSIVVLFEPLSINALGSLLGTSDSEIQQTYIEEMLSQLLSVLEVPESTAEPIRLLHPSFRDFLLSEKRCQETQLQVDGKHAHWALVNHCLGVMTRLLRRDICGLQRPGTLLSDVTKSQVEQFIPPELQYACLYWIQHLEKSDTPLHDEEEVHQFLRKHLLHWLEALAWLERTSEAILALISLEAQIRSDKSPDLHEFIRDAKRVAVSNRKILEESPLQLYCSAIIFAPQDSIVRRAFNHSVPQWIQTKPKVRQHWDATLHTLEGHSGEVVSVAFSPDSKVIASASGDNTVRLWDAVTGAVLQRLDGRSDFTTSVAFSPDGKLVAWASTDRTVRLWNAATGAASQILEGHFGYVTSVAFSPNSKVVATASKDNTIRLWDVMTGTAYMTLKGHSTWVTSVSFSPDGNVIASASGDNTVRLWDAVTGAARQTLEGHSDCVNSVGFSPNSKVVASSSDDNTVRLWDTMTGATLQTLDRHFDWVPPEAFLLVASALWDKTVRLWDVVTRSASEAVEGHWDRVTSVAFSADGKMIASASEDNRVRVSDAVTGATRQMLEGHLDWVNSVAFSPDSKVIASASEDNTVRLWDGLTGLVHQTLEGHSACVTSVAFSPDGNVVASASGDRTVKLWDPVAGAACQTLEGHSARVILIAFSPDGKVIASASEDKTVKLWNVVTGAELQTLHGHSDRVTSVAFSPHNKLIASASEDNTVRLWDVMTGAASQTLEGHSNPVTSVAFSLDGKVVASASEDNTVRLWDVVTGATRQTLEGHSDWVNSVAFSPDGKIVVSSSHDNTVRFWDAVTGSALQTLEGRSDWVTSEAFSLFASASWDNTGRLWDAVTRAAARQTFDGDLGKVTSVAFSPDGNVVASASQDSMVRLWDVVTGATYQTLEGHWNRVTSVAFSPDGKVIASASEDNTVRLWDVVTGAARQTLKGHSDWVNSVAFSPDSKMVASSSHDNTIRFWDTVTGAVLQALESHLHWLNPVAFSPDSNVDASDEEDNTSDEEDNSITSVAFSPDGKLIAAASDDNTVRLWNAVTGAPRGRLEGHSHFVTSVAFSPDGKVIASASADRTVMLWDAVTGAARQTLEGHLAGVTSVAFSPDGKVVTSASHDQTVRLWDAVTGKVRQTLKGRSAEVNSIAFSPDGKVVDTLLLSGDWIQQGEERIIWLHPDHRGEQTAIQTEISVLAQMGIVVLAQSSGRLLIMRFKSGPKVV